MPDTENMAMAPLTFVLPPYQAGAETSWLKVIEHAFRTYQVTNEDRKIHHLLSALPAEIQGLCTHLLDPSVDDRYAKLLEIISSQNKITDSQRLKQLIGKEPIGDRTPTQFLHHLRKLQGEDGDANSSLLRTIFLEALSPQTQLILAPVTFSTLDAAATAADRIYETLRHTTTPVQVISKVEPTNAWQAEADALRVQINRIRIDNEYKPHPAPEPQQTVLMNKILQSIEALTHSVTQLQRQLTYDRPPQHFSRDRSSSRHRNSDYSNKRNRNRDALNPTWCAYHNQFRENARNCTQPCSFETRPKNS